MPLQFPTIDYKTSEKPAQDRLWLLGFLKAHLSNCQLAFFAKYFVPIFEKLQKNRASAKKENRLYEAKVAENVLLQLWDLWTPTARSAGDIAEGFPLVGMILIFKNTPFAFLTRIQSEIPV